MKKEEVSGIVVVLNVEDLLLNSGLKSSNLKYYLRSLKRDGDIISYRISKKKVKIVYAEDLEFKNDIKEEFESKVGKV